ncbi:MAG TPA: XrtA/PEP-CTERM system exopolysaccharide export protein [Steroidobacteraceae bacterium]|nr:XrtA/PEP-CTERM system exopolysaccharide export protein [Steroidobacteraceae bacterium]
MKNIASGLLAVAALWAMSMAANAQEPAPAQSKTDANYLIGPGDQLQIFVWRNPELTVSVPVKPDGRITTPLVENIIANGKSTDQLARDIEGVLSQYIRSPQVNVIVLVPHNVQNEIKVVGQLKNPQGVAFRAGLTALDVVLAAGGLTEFAAGNRSKIVRTVDGKRSEIKVRLDDIVSKGDMRTNTVLMPGDVLIVPESRF